MRIIGKATIRESIYLRQKGDAPKGEHWLGTAKERGKEVKPGGMIARTKKGVPLTKAQFQHNVAIQKRRREGVSPTAKREERNVASNSLSRLGEAYGFRADALSEKYAKLKAAGKHDEAEALQARHRARVKKEDAQLKAQQKKDKKDKKASTNGVHDSMQPIGTAMLERSEQGTLTDEEKQKSGKESAKRRVRLRKGIDPEVYGKHEEQVKKDKEKTK